MHRSHNSLEMQDEGLPLAFSYGMLDTICQKKKRTHRTKLRAFCIWWTGRAGGGVIDLDLLR